MASREDRNKSFKKAFCINVIPFLKDIHSKCKLGYNSIDVKNTSDKHSIPAMTVPIMVDLQILSCTGQKKNAKFHWKDGIIINDDLASKIYDKMSNYKKIIKANKTLQLNHGSRKLVPIIGSKRPLDFKKDQTAMVILRAMTAVYSSTNGDSIATYGMIKDMILKEVNNETMSERILKSLLDGNYIICKRTMSNKEYNMYSWKEQEPNEEHACFIKELINEDSGGDRANRVFDFLMLLSKLTMYTSLNMRKKCKEYKLSSNDQSILTAEVLDHTGGKLNRQYKWKNKMVPSLELAKVIVEKSRVYGSKYSKGKTKVDEKLIFKVDSYKVKHDKPIETPKYGPQHAAIIEYLNTNTDITTDKACKLLNIPKNAVSNIFWRLCKDDITFRVAHKLYAMHDHLKKPVDSIKTHKRALHQIETNDPFIENLKVALDTMNSRKAKLEAELKEINDKIKEGEDLLKLRDKENLYLASCSKFIKKTNFPSIVKPSASLASQAIENSQRKKYPHNKKEILEILNKKEQVSMDDLVKHFYPGKGLNWNNNEVKSLAVMLYGLKKEKALSSPSTGIFKIIR